MVQSVHFQLKHDYKESIHKTFLTASEDPPVVKDYI